MQKNLGYVIPNIVIPDATTAIGYWYLGSTPLGFRATGTMWTIGTDHYWYCDNIKTQYLAEIPVEDYNEQFEAMIEQYGEDWTTYFNARKAEWTAYYAARQVEWTDYFNDKQSEFTTWFDAIKDQLDSDAAGHLQNEINAAALDVFKRYYGMLNAVTEFKPDGSIAQENDEAVLNTTFSYNSAGYKVITEQLQPKVVGSTSYTKITTIIPATDTTNKIIREEYTIV